MSGFKKFAIVGAGNIGGYFAEELLKKKASGEIDELVIVTRPVRRVLSRRAAPTHPLPLAAS